FVALRWVHRAGLPYVRRSRQASADLFGFLEERLSSLVDLQASGAQAYTLARLRPLQRTLFHTTRRAWMMGAFLGSTVDLVFVAGWVIGLGLGAVYYRAGTLSIGTIYLLFQYVTMLRAPLNELSEEAQDFQRAGASIARVTE